MVPRYYFHVYNDETVLDEEGQEFPDATAAHNCAVKEARVLMTESVMKGHIVLSHHIRIEDADGAHVGNVTFGEAVTIRP
ncbi:MAG TPA: hypothetical protein VGX37_10805 [Allosphingosinicella sp.]|nr:hypothetical protein [Allosphingosinicella sp.]